MASVTPSSMNDAYYNQILGEHLRAQTEQERSHEAEVAQMRKAHDADLSSMEEKHRQERLADSERTQATVDKIREEATDTISENRKMLEAESDRLKGQIYDRYGRYNSRVTDEEFQNAKNAWEEQAAARDRAIRDLDVQHRRSQEDSAERHAAALERAVKATRDSASQTFSAEREEQKQAHLDTRDQLKKEYGRLSRNLAEDASAINRATIQALDEQHKDFEHKAAQVEKSKDRSLERIGGENYARTERSLSALRDSYNAQAVEQTRQKQALLDERSRYAKDYSTGRSDAIAQFESDAMSDMRRLQETHEAENQKQGQVADERERYLTKAQKDAVAERDNHYAALIRRINQDHYERSVDANKNFDKGIQDLKIRAELDRKYSSESRERQSLTAAEQQELSLKKQAEAYQETLRNQRENYETQISNLDQKVKSYRSGDDPEVPVAAEAAARKSLTKHYDKILTAEHERNKRSQDSMQREYLDRIKDIREESDHAKLVTNLKATGERDADRAQFIDHTYQVAAEKLDAIRKKDWEAERSVEQINKTFSRSMVEQKRKFQEAMEVARADNESRSHAIRQESEFDRRLRHREFNVKTSEIINQYERELAKTREDHQDQLKLVQEESDKKVRHAERQLRDMMEEQQRSHEAEKKQAEQRSEERQRSIAANYEEQLEKTRRANARILQKKS